MLPYTTITMTPHERQSGSDRQSYAESLIQQLPKDHDGRNTWLLNYGRSVEARDLRISHRLDWNPTAQAAETSKPGAGGHLARMRCSDPSLTAEEHHDE